MRDQQYKTDNVCITLWHVDITMLAMQMQQCILCLYHTVHKRLDFWKKKNVMVIKHAF